MKQILQIFFQRVLHFLNRPHPLAGQGETAVEQGGTGNGYHHHCHHPAVLLAMPPAESIHHGHEQQQGDETAQISEQHTVNGKQIAVARFGTYNSQQRSVWNIDGRINHHHQRVGDVGINNLSAQAPLRGGKRKDADERERHGKEQQVGAELAPTRVSAVCQNSDNGVEGGIPYPGDQEHGTHYGSRHPKHVSIEYHEIGTKELPEHG